MLNRLLSRVREFDDGVIELKAVLAMTCIQQAEPREPVGDDTFVDRRQASKSIVI